MERPLSEVPLYLYIYMYHSYSRRYYNSLCSTAEPPIKDAPNKGHLRIKDTIQSTKKSLSYSASTFLNKGHLLWSPGVLYSEVPLYIESMHV